MSECSYYQRRVSILRKSFLSSPYILKICTRRYQINSYKHFMQKRCYRLWFVVFLRSFIFVHICDRANIHEHNMCMNAKLKLRSDREGSKDNNVFDEENGTTRVVICPQYELHWRLKLVRGEKKKKKKSTCATSGCRRCRDLHIKWVGIYNGRSFERC